MLSKNNGRTLSGGIIATIIVSIGAFVIGSVSGYEARELIKSSLPGINTLCNTIALAAATILALLLTLLSVSSGSNSKLKSVHYEHVLLIAKIDTVIFVASLITFQLLNIPITESESVPDSWFSIIYYISLFMASILSGALISVALMLYNTIENIIKIIGLGQEDHPLLYVEEQKNKEE